MGSPFGVGTTVVGGVGWAVGAVVGAVVGLTPGTAGGMTRNTEPTSTFVVPAGTRASG